MSLVSGILAAIPTPVQDDGAVDVDAFDRLVDFVVRAGVDGVCIGGATGEYPHFEASERAALIRHAAKRLPPDRALAVGIGSSSIRRTVELGRTAMDAGARALLLPMPMFFTYEQDDLYEYCAHVSRTLKGPCLLYDLPHFTNELMPSTALALLHDEPFIVGIKDSSGRASNLAALAADPRRAEWTLLVGDDRLLREGIDAGWNGGVSGVAACCPELIVALMRSARDGDREKAVRLQGVVDEVVAQLSRLPTPWGIRVALAARGFDTGPLPLPRTPARKQGITELQDWMRQKAPFGV
jgi:4-hydroxy-tetrahydrodipicolinate synthase